jgi:hypothetical protein
MKALEDDNSIMYNVKTIESIWQENIDIIQQSIDQVSGRLATNVVA